MGIEECKMLLNKSHRYYQIWGLPDESNSHFLEKPYFINFNGMLIIISKQKKYRNSSVILGVDWFREGKNDLFFYKTILNGNKINIKNNYYF